MSKHSVLRDIVPILEGGVVKDIALIFSWSSPMVCDLPVPVDDIQFYWADYITKHHHNSMIHGASTAL
jgi:hypothetical protein